ncbi:cleavage and polyadenylation specificity factor subunit 3-I isoform X2 [Physcomitrium patens]|nr:cleavage and polyadenylation specificity factor subunit 3-I-like isoform X2 [Physcomitrium patens]|eukprot:XP_024376319.1 cleavage and polyadenylation specificity factor subunit 3-I-like isoform X2 [Physcomitrella patens]
MTHATKAIYKLLLSDFVKISKVSVDDMLYDEHDIARTMEKIEVIDFHQTMEVNGIRFWCYTAGHVLGAAMFMVDIAGMRVLYTGDYSCEEDRHLRAAEMPHFSPDVCIIESTYGVQIHQPRIMRERRFTDTVAQTVSQGGKVLIPAFALGRAQELLLILDEYWEAHPELQHIPIYYASPLAKKCMAVYQTYINAMNDRIQKQFEVSNPFDFKHIQPLKNIDGFDDIGPAVVMASPGGLQSGLSRQLFDIWCQDKKNSCIIPGYVVEGTLAKAIMNEPKEVTLLSGLVVPLNMRVHYISFSAHADFTQTNAFLHELRPPNIILVHGEANEMGRLKAKLITQFAEQNVKILSPKNCQTVEMFFKGEKIAKAVGRLAEKSAKEGDIVSGLLVRKGFTYQLMAPDDLHSFTQLSTGSVMQRQSVPYKGTFTVLRHRLQQMYEQVEVVTKADSPTLKVHGNLTVTHEGADYVILQWVSDPISDMVADSVVAMILKLDSQSMFAVGGGRAKEARLEKEEIKIVHSLLVSLFGDVTLDEEHQSLTVNVDGIEATIDHVKRGIECKDENLKDRIKVALRRIQTALYPLDA